MAESVALETECLDYADADEPSVVAVHGIGGDSYSTFTDKLSNQLWLRDFLPRSTEFQNARILTFGYEAQVFAAPGETASTGRIFTFGEALLSALNDARVPQGARNRPIIFVAHSLGGLVVKSVCIKIYRLGIARRLLRFRRLCMPKPN